MKEENNSKMLEKFYKVITNFKNIDYDKIRLLLYKIDENIIDMNIDTLIDFADSYETFELIRREIDYKNIDKNTISSIQHLDYLYGKFDHELNIRRRKTEKEYNINLLINTRHLKELIYFLDETTYAKVSEIAENLELSHSTIYKLIKNIKEERLLHDSPYIPVQYSLSMKGERCKQDYEEFINSKAKRKRLVKVDKQQ